MRADLCAWCGRPVKPEEQQARRGDDGRGAPRVEGGDGPRAGSAAHGDVRDALDRADRSQTALEPLELGGRFIADAVAKGEPVRKTLRLHIDNRWASFCALSLVFFVVSAGSFNSLGVVRINIPNPHGV